MRTLKVASASLAVAAVLQETDVDVGSDFRVREVELSFAAAGSVVPIMVEYFSPVGIAKPAVALILPIMSSNFLLERFFARGFAAAGVASVVVTGGRSPSEFVSFQGLEDALRDAVIADRRVLDWIETRPELDASRISAVGVSLGAIRASLLAAVDPRVSSAVLALAGGDMASIVTASSERLLVTARKAYMRERKLGSEDLTRVLCDVLVSDPISYAPYLDPARVLLVLARNDTSIPYANGLALRSALGNPETLTLPTGHYTSVFFAPFIRDEALAFMRRVTIGQPGSRR